MRRTTRRLRIEARLWRTQGGWVWLLLGITACGAVMLVDLSRLIGDVQLPNHYSYDASVFTNPHLPNNTEKLADAVDVWKAAQDEMEASCKAQPTEPCQPGVQRLLYSHILTDLVFTLAYALLLYQLLLILAPKVASARRLAIWVFIADEAENVVSLFAIARFHSNHGLLVILQCLTLLKWLALAFAIVTIAGAFWLKWRRHRSHPGRKLLPLLALTAAFSALVALPAGGALEQLPDVVRASFGEWPFWFSWLGVILFAAATSVAGRLCLQGSAGTKETEPSKVADLVAILIALAVSMALALSHGRWTPPPWAPFIVVAVIWIAARLVHSVQSSEPDAPVANPAPAPPAPLLSTSTTAAAAADEERRRLTKKERRWIAATSSAVILIGGLGMIRAAFPPLIVGVDSGRFNWGVFVAAGAVITVLGGYLFQRITASILERAEGSNVARYTIMVGVAVAATLLAFCPEQAWLIGSLGVVSVCFALFALVIGVLRRVSRHIPPWWATQTLGFGRFIPLLTILWLSWSLASALNTQGLYHDARIIEAPKDEPAVESNSAPPYANLLDAFTTWTSKQEQCRSKNATVWPMVMVAAAGGGIRAAFWTADTLDQLFLDDNDVKRLPNEVSPCLGVSLIAISSVSGGSVGAATYVASAAADMRAADQVKILAKDRALAATMAGFFLRDLAQPLLGRRWPDRAALLEDGWQENTVFAYDDAYTWSKLGRKLTWTPILAMNASSVSDGCRVLVANTRSLPAAPSGDCTSRPEAPSGGGAVSSSIDALAGLIPRTFKETKCPSSLPFNMRSVTAMLLSARFPYVTPTGAIVRCETDNNDRSVARVSYVVDGGYYENSGILTLLQIWAELEPLVREYNKTHRIPIAPWIVVADNAYRGSAMGRASGRPRELLAPMRAKGNDNQLIEQEALEQMASIAIRPRPAPDCNQSTGCDARLVAASETDIANCLVVITPTRRPTVPAPLGWVLSTLSQTDLHRQLMGQLETPAAIALKEQLTGTGATSENPNCVWGSVRHVMRIVRHLHSAATFYDPLMRSLGLRAIRREQNYISYANEQLLVTIADTPREVAPLGPDPTLLVIEVSEQSQLEDFYSVATKLGGRAQRQSNSAEVTDPDGNNIEVRLVRAQR